MPTNFNFRKFVELNFNENDRQSECTLFIDDFVQFKIATDKRTKVMRATELKLMEHSLLNNKREFGVINLKHQQQNLNNKNKLVYGAIKCLERDDLIYFDLNEFINNYNQIDVGDSVEFQVIECQKVDILNY